MDKYLEIYEENERREQALREKEQYLSDLLDGLGLKGGAPQW